MRANSYTIIFTLTILLGVFFNAAASKLKHECNHHELAKSYNPVIVEPTPEEEAERKLQQNKPRNMIITYELLKYDTLPQKELYFREIVDKSFKVAIKYFHDLIMIVPKHRKYSRYVEERYINGTNHKCHMAEITPEQQRVERVTDLHLYITYDHNQNSTAVASAQVCKGVTGLGPTHGAINVNKAHFSKSNFQDSRGLEDGHRLEDVIELITHEITHILGFSSNQILYGWVDQNKQKHKDPVTYEDWKGYKRAFISTPNVLAFTRKHFNCDSLPGMPIQTYYPVIDNKTDKPHPGHHWQLFTTLNEIMNPFTVNTQAVFTNFTASLLRDTGYYYSINENLIDYTTYGKDAGCNFFWGKCDAGRYPEICQPQKDGYLCDFYHEGRSQCSKGKDGCNSAYVISEHRCYEENSKYDTREQNRKYGTRFGSNTKCFNSNLIDTRYATKDSQEQMQGQCYEFMCNDAHQVSVKIGTTSVVCSKNSQEIRVRGFEGVLRCPENLENFCGMKKFCPGACSGNGYCRNGICHCIDGWLGPTCAARLPQRY